MKRRKLLIALGAGAFAASLDSFAQQPAKIARIGFLGALSPADLASRFEGLRAGLRDFGYVQGRNIVIEYRWAEGNYDRLPAVAAELVRLNVGVILVHHSQGVRAAMRTTSKIPIVMTGVGDAVDAGFVASLARPGGNVTGLTWSQLEISTKRLELLKQVLPRARRVAVLLNPSNPGINKAVLDAMELASAPLKMELQAYEARSANEIWAAFLEMAKRRVDAVVTIDDPMLISNAEALGKFATRQGIPSLGGLELVEGGLMAYTVDFDAMWRRAAYFVDQILHGVDPDDLPVERPSKFEFVVNLKTAKALGVRIPPQMLQRAGKVIE